MAVVNPRNGCADSGIDDGPVRRWRTGTGTEIAFGRRTDGPQRIRPLSGLRHVSRPAPPDGRRHDPEKRRNLLLLRKRLPAQDLAAANGLPGQTAGGDRSIGGQRLLFRRSPSTGARPRGWPGRMWWAPWGRPSSPWAMPPNWPPSKTVMAAKPYSPSIRSMTRCGKQSAAASCQRKKRIEPAVIVHRFSVY